MDPLSRDKRRLYTTNNWTSESESKGKPCGFMKQAECESSRVLLLGATTYAGSRTSSPTTLTTALMTQARLGQNKTETGYMCNPHTVTAIYTSTCKYSTSIMLNLRMGSCYLFCTYYLIEPLMPRVYTIVRFDQKVQ